MTHVRFTQMSERMAASLGSLLFANAFSVVKADCVQEGERFLWLLQTYMENGFVTF